MKALILESNGKLEYATVPTPKARGDECLIRVKAAGVCNSDIFRAFENGSYHYPLIMGHEFSGKIVECGKDVSDFGIGQGVVAFSLIPGLKCDTCKRKKWVHCKSYDYYGSRCNGEFAEFISVKSWNLIAVPKGCDLALAALTEPLKICWKTCMTQKSIPCLTHT